MSGPVPSPSMKGMVGRSGTCRTPPAIEIRSPSGGTWVNWWDMRGSGAREQAGAMSVARWAVVPNAWGTADCPYTAARIIACGAEPTSRMAGDGLQRADPLPLLDHHRVEDRPPARDRDLVHRTGWTLLRDFG